MNDCFIVLANPEFPPDSEFITYEKGAEFHWVLSDWDYVEEHFQVLMQQTNADTGMCPCCGRDWGHYSYVAYDYEMDLETDLVIDDYLEDFERGKQQIISGFANG